MQRSFVVNRGSLEVRTNFGDGKSFSIALEVKSKIDKNNKVTVLETNYLGKPSNWDKEKINLYLMDLYELEDNE